MEKIVEDCCYLQKYQCCSLLVKYSNIQSANSNKLQLSAKTALVMLVQRGRSNTFLRNINEFQTFQRIGEGEFGHVFKCLDRANQEILAMKKIKLMTQKQGIPSNVIRELATLREINHKNVVRLKYVIKGEDLIYLYFEFLESDLRSYLAKLGGRSMDRLGVKMYLYYMLDGIAQCHSKKIIHRDLKTANILINSQGALKIADFGLARFNQFPMRPYSQEVVTMWYRAPEVLLGASDYSGAVDIWSIGCIFGQMVTGTVLFQGNSQGDQLFRIFKLLGTPNESRWPGIAQLKQYKTDFPIWQQGNLQNLMIQYDLGTWGIDLMHKLLDYNPNSRISAKAALFHPYFEDIRK